MPDFDFDNFEQTHDQPDAVTGQSMAADGDLIMEQILDNLNTTPIGQVLKKIASLPEVRGEKVLDVRQQLTCGNYDLSERLDVALDRVLEELMT